MDPITVLGAPMLGAACQQLAAIGWEAFTNWNKNRKDEPILATDNSALRGELGPLQMDKHFENMLEIYQDLQFLRDGYGDSGPFHLDDEPLLAALTRLRGNLEALFGQHITFLGEDDRPVSGARIKIRMRARKIEDSSEAAAIVGEAPQGEIDIDFEAEDIKGGSRAYAIKREVQ